MNNTGIILTLAYPDTIVRISDEKLVSYFRFFGIGKKNYVRAGHAALVIIEKKTGYLEYFDFGRYTTPQGYGRVRAKDTDCELDFPLKADIANGAIENINEIIRFLATNSNLTHGEGRMVVSICEEINYKRAKTFVNKLKEQGLIKYAVFAKNASNCSRFVTDTLIASVTNSRIKKRLVASNWFTPSTVGNVMKSSTYRAIYQVSENGDISTYSSTTRVENLRCFLDRLSNFEPDLVGNLKPKPIKKVHKKAQWLEGIGAGAWFEIHPFSEANRYRFRRISPHGNVDVDDYCIVNDTSFDYHDSFQFIHYSNCKFFHVQQHEKIFRFDRVSED